MNNLNSSLCNNSSNLSTTSEPSNQLLSNISSNLSSCISSNLSSRISSNLSSSSIPSNRTISNNLSSRISNNVSSRITNNFSSSSIQSNLILSNVSNQFQPGGISSQYYRTYGNISNIMCNKKKRSLNTTMVCNAFKRKKTSNLQEVLNKDLISVPDNTIDVSDLCSESVSSVSECNSITNDDENTDIDLEFICPEILLNNIDVNNLQSNLYAQLITKSKNVIIENNNMSTNDNSKPLYDHCNFTLQDFLVSTMYKKKIKNYGDEDIFLDCNLIAKFLPPNNMLAKCLENYNNTRSFIRYMSKSCSELCKPLNTYRLGILMYY